MYDKQIMDVLIIILLCLLKILKLDAILPMQFNYCDFHSRQLYFNFLERFIWAAFNKEFYQITALRWMDHLR